MASIPVLPAQTKWQKKYSTFANFDTLIDTFTLIGPDPQKAADLYFYMRENGIEKADDISARAVPSYFAH